MPADAAELSQIASEAQDIARNVGQAPGTHHLLLATFTVPSPADSLLRERGCDEDKVLQELVAGGAPPQEPAAFFHEALESPRQRAAAGGGGRGGGLPLLVALPRLSRSAAAQLLEKTAA